MTLPSHLFVSDDGGALHDTRLPLWASNPIRVNYSRHHSAIDNAHDLKATLRAGGFTFPGGYPLYFVMGDGEVMAFESVRENLRECLEALKSGYRNDSWRVVACQINYENDDLICAHTGKRIESAYGEGESE